MKLLCCLIGILALSSLAPSQSGRRPKAIKTPVPAPSPELVSPTKPETGPTSDKMAVTAEKNVDYRCSDDGSLEQLLEPIDELVISAKNVDQRAEITRRPTPSYTREARRTWVQGFVTLRLLLSANGKLSRIRVVKGLRAGLTENAIRAACLIEFKPAIKDGQPVSQWVEAEYVFRLY